MFTCKQVSNALSKQDYADMPFFKRIGLKLHVMVCIVCHRYNKDVMLMQDTCRHIRHHEDDTLHRKEHLEDAQKQRIQEAVRKSLES